jgi:hypothetical protein
MDRQPFLLQKLTQRLLGRREIDVGDDIKIANAIADEVLVDFPTTIRQEEILVDFPDKSNGNHAADDDEDDEDCDEDGFLGFPEGGRKPVVAREWQTPNSHRKDTSQQLPLQLLLRSRYEIKATAYLAICNERRTMKGVIALIPHNLITVESEKKCRGNRQRVLNPKVSRNIFISFTYHAQIYLASGVRLYSRTPSLPCFLSLFIVVVIDNSVVHSNPILESFGNARTLRNDNSSRFGKFIDVRFHSNGRLKSASVQTYTTRKSKTHCTRNRGTELSCLL